MSRDNWVHYVFTKWGIGCLLWVCLIILGLFILSIYYFHAWQLQRCAALCKGSEILNSSLTDWQLQAAQFCPITRSTVRLILPPASSGREKLLPEFVTAETSTFDWQASLLSGQTQPISLISSMVFPDFVSTRLGFVSKDLSFSLLFKDSLGLASVFQCKSVRKYTVYASDRCRQVIFFLPPHVVITHLLCVVREAKWVIWFSVCKKTYLRARLLPWINNMYSIIPCQYGATKALVRSSNSISNLLPLIFHTQEIWTIPGSLEKWTCVQRNYITGFELLSQALSSSRSFWHLGEYLFHLSQKNWNGHFPIVLSEVF